MSEGTDWDRVRQRVDRVRAAAEHGLLNDPRFRRMVDASVAWARDEAQAFNHDRPERSAHELAILACALLLARVYDEDGEISMAHAERDHFKRIAEEGLHLRPLVYQVSNPAPASKSEQKEKQG